MMAELWSGIEDDFAASARHFQKAVEFFEAYDLRTRPGQYLEEIAFLHAMQSGYVPFEAGLKRLFALIGEELPLGGDSYAALLRRAHRPRAADRPAILNDMLFKAADELRGFRHVAMHAYDTIDGERAALAVRSAKTFLGELAPALARFRAAIDPDEATTGADETPS